VSVIGSTLASVSLRLEELIHQPTGQAASTRITARKLARITHLRVSINLPS
jgi:hypothetical protein